MSVRLAPYSETKDSGMSWLGVLPAHWEVWPNRALFEEIKDQNHPEEPLLSVTISRGVVRQADLLSDTSKKDSSNLDKAKYKLVRPSDIAYNKMRAWQGAIGVSRFRGIVSPAYIVERPRRGVVPEYMHHLFRTPAFAKEAERWSYGITSDQWSLRPEHFKMIYSLLPPVAEQNAIVRFLNHVDRRVNRLIRAKRRLIALLNEQKQAIIHRAVTRGLDPDVQLKPSGVDWLGDVPEHWDLVGLGRFVRLTTGFPFKSSGFSQAQADIRLLRGINVAPGRIRWDSVVRWPASDCRGFSDFEMEPGDIVLGMDRPIIGGGIRVAVVTEEDVPSLLLQRVARIRPRDGLKASFALLLLSGKGFSDYLAPIFTGISVPHVSPEQIGAFRVGLPNEEEQSRIIAWVEDATVEMDSVIDRATREIEFVREYRTRLIADVVTGKLDVWEAAANLPEEPIVPEVLDESDVEGLEDEAGSEAIEAED